MILLWGLEQDDTFRSVLKVLRASDAEFLFINHAAIDRTEVKVTTSSRPEYLLCLDGVTHGLSKFDAAYLRPYDHRLYGADGAGRQDLVLHFMNTWAEHTPAFVINRPSANATNFSKLRQASIIRRSGFAVPESLVSNDLDSIREFHTCHGALIYKSMSSTRSVVQQVDLDELAALGPFGPTLFQRRIDGLNVRVHVVEDDTVACSIQSRGIDYRYNECKMEPFQLPKDVAEQCIALTKCLGLKISGIDLIRTADGQFYCLEANPNPAFAAFDLDGSAEVAQLVARALRRG